MDSEVAVMVSMTATRVPDQEATGGVFQSLFASSGDAASVCPLGFLPETAVPEEWTGKTRDGKKSGMR